MRRREPITRSCRPARSRHGRMSSGSARSSWRRATAQSTSTTNSWRARPGPASAVGGGRQTIYAVGLNWYPNVNMRFMLDYLHGTIDKRFSAAAGGGVAGTAPGAPVGGNFDAVVLRTQV